MSGECLGKAAAKVGEVEATHFLENEWGQKIPKEVIETGLMQEARFAHMN